MSFSMSGGSYSYNRFDKFNQLVEGAKPDFLDMDKDGNKKESFKKAVKDKEKGGEQKECTCKEWVESLLDEGYDLSEYTWDDMERMFSEGMHREADTGKVVKKAEIGKTYYPNMPRQKSSVAIRKEKSMKEEVCQYLMDEGYTNNEVSAEVLFNHMSDEWLNSVVGNIEERWVGKHGQFDTEYARSRSQGGKMISGDDKRSGAEYTHGRRVKASNPGMQPDVGGKTKPKSQGRMDAATRADLQYRKANLKKKKG